ncbi:MAG TPA: urea ABC transporter permease subunit UrtC [Polyangiaceae bacterium]|nr:urea ABC transporter permease subunit UrtC [Polyangiaceae bacterium]
MSVTLHKPPPPTLALTLSSIMRPVHWNSWVAGAVCLIVGVVVPVLNVATSEKSALHASDFLVSLVGKLTCYAIVAVAMDLVWGYAGVLSLCHAMFFALGGYAMGMYLMRAIGTEGMYRSNLPDFMVFLDWKELPWYWEGFNRFGFALAMALVVPGVVAFVFGFFAFRSRITGVYFSIVTQAMTYAAMLLFFRNATGFGGNNGLTDFKRILGYPLRDPSTRAALCALTGLGLGATYVLCRAIVGSRAGRVLTAMRDAEAKVRFSGYNPVTYKLFAWTVSAMLCGLAGALYVPQVGIINPSEMQPSSSVEIAIWVAVGGRGTLAGAILGAFLVNGMKSWLTVAFPTAWLYFLGVLFVVVTLVLPGGIVESFAGIAKGRGVLARLLIARSKRSEDGQLPVPAGSVAPQPAVQGSVASVVASEEQPP